MKSKVLLSLFILTLTFFSTPALAVTRVATPAGLLNRAVAAQTRGTVASLSTSSFTITTPTGTITVNVLANTILLRRFGGKSSLSEFSVGDQVQVVGKATDTSRTSIDARLIRNVSIQKRYGTFAGTIQSVSASGFILQSERRSNQTVTVSTKTKITDRQSVIIPFSGLVVGHKVRLHGLWDSKLNTVTDVSYVRDYSLPLPRPPIATTSATR